MMVSTPADFERELFGPKAVIECLMAKEDGRAVGFALYFHNFSTFLGRRGLYLEDLYVKPECRGKGYGKALLVRLAQIAGDAVGRCLHGGDRLSGRWGGTAVQIDHHGRRAKAVGGVLNRQVAPGRGGRFLQADRGGQALLHRAAVDNGDGRHARSRRRRRHGDG